MEKMETPLGAIHAIDSPGTHSFSPHLLSPHHSHVFKRSHPLDRMTYLELYITPQLVALPVAFQQINCGSCQLPLKVNHSYIRHYFTHSEKLYSSATFLRYCYSSSGYFLLSKQQVSFYRAHAASLITS